MLQAQLRGKLYRNEENLEDLLTSNVFGSFKYVPPEEALLTVLSSSRNSEGRVAIHAAQPRLSAEYSFWPWLQEQGCEGCEPDVLINIRLADMQKVLVLIEAKYLSDKSSEANEQMAPTDQLAREWDNLTCLANREKAIPILLYVTADLGLPRKSIEDSCQEYVQKRKLNMTVYWISWRKLPTLFSDTKHEILKDLVEVLRTQGLTFFEGITRPTPIDIKWSFGTAANWDWSTYREYNICWKYQPNRQNL